MKKYYCDRCGEEIKDGLINCLEVKITNNYGSRSSLKDICDKCMVLFSEEYKAAVPVPKRMTITEAAGSIVKTFRNILGGREDE